MISPLLFLTGDPLIRAHLFPATSHGPQVATVLPALSLAGRLPKFEELPYRHPMDPAGGAWLAGFGVVAASIRHGRRRPARASPTGRG